MGKFWLVCAVVLTVCISSCVDKDKDLSQGNPENESNLTDFSTKQSVQVIADYSTIDSRVPFFIYDKNPVKPQDANSQSTTITIDESIDPLDGGWTDENGKYNKTMSLPAYVSEVYVVTTSPFATQPVIKGKVENGVLKISETDEQPETRANTSGKRYTQFDSNRFKSLNWKTDLGAFDAQTGEMKDYLYDGELKLSKYEMKELKTTINSVLKNSTSFVCPEAYRKGADLYIEDDNTAVALTALSGWTCWNSSLGYYYYRADNAPKTQAELDAITKYTIFPNTQTSWNNGYGISSYPRGITEGESVQLKYYDTEHPKGTIYFPKGYKIGFVLATNAWNTYFTAFRFDFPYFAYSTEIQGGKVRTAMFKDSKGNIAITFEDYKDDQNFTDVLFALKANPEITNVPTVDPEANTTIKKTGVFSFEDYWPKAFDYDMNDVVVLYTYEKKFNIYNEILKESFTFEPHSDTWQATMNNGLAFSMKNLGSYREIEKSFMKRGNADYQSADFVQENNVFILADNVKSSEMRYQVSIKYDKGKKTAETSVDAFIFRPGDNGTRREIHIPMQAPTAKADRTLFNTEDDRSIPEKGIYYVSDKNKIYPFAFYLEGANLQDVAPLLKEENEGMAISELYPKFIGWAKNNNTNKDWYKK